MELPFEDPTLCGCCQKERKEQMQYEQQMTKLRSVDVSMDNIKKREQMFLFSKEGAFSSYSSPAFQTTVPSHVKLVRNEDLTLLRERLRNAKTPVVVHFYKQEVRRRLEKLDAVLKDRNSYAELMQVPVVKWKLAEKELGITSLPSLAVFKDGRLLEQRSIYTFIKNNVLNINKVLEFLRNHLSGFSSDEESESEEECELCHRRYPHQHVLPSTIPTSEDSSSDEEESY